MTLEEVENSLPSGFHDARLHRLEIDWTSAQAAFELWVDVTDTDDTQEYVQRARVEISGLGFISFEAPQSVNEATSAKGLWIDAEALSVAPDGYPPIPSGYFLHRIYVNNWNRFLFVCGQEATLIWLEATRVPLRRR